MNKNKSHDLLGQADLGIGTGEFTIRLFSRSVPTTGQHRFKVNPVRVKVPSTVLRGFEIALTPFGADFRLLGTFFAKFNDPPDRKIPNPFRPFQSSSS